MGEPAGAAGEPAGAAGEPAAKGEEAATSAAGSSGSVKAGKLRLGPARRGGGKDVDAILLGLDFSEADARSTAYKTNWLASNTQPTTTQKKAEGGG